VAYVIPTVIIILTQILFKFTKHRFQHIVDHPCTSYTEHFLMPHLAMVEGVGIALFITVLLKNFVGRLRPNFFAMCNYKGYRDALSGNDTLYLSLTTAGAVGSLDHCWETDIAKIHEAQYSFPSGHASFAFAGLTFLTFFLFHVAPRYFKLMNSKSVIRFLPFKITILLVLFISAAVIAGTRTRDYWHNFDDILAGSVIGFACASFAFWVNHERIQHEREDNSEETRGVTRVNV